MGSVQLWDIQAPITVQPAYPRMWANPRADFAAHAATSPSIRAPLGEMREPSACLLIRCHWERERETRFAQSIRSFCGLTLAVEVHSQLRAAEAWLPAVRHHCPPRSCDGAPRERRRPESTPSGVAARWTAWGSTQTSVPWYRQQNNGCRVI